MTTWTREGLDRLMRALRYDAELGTKSDAEIADLLLNRVWATMRLDTFESALIDEAIRRLDPARGAADERQLKGGNQ